MKTETRTNVQLMAGLENPYFNQVRGVIVVDISVPMN